VKGAFPGTRGAARLRLQRSRVGRPRPWWLLVPVLGLLAYLAWPYVSLWRLSIAASHQDASPLAPLVDLDAVRGEIRRKLNKTASSAIGKVSDPFIQWLEPGIQRLGTGALDQLVTLAWVQERLGANSPPRQGFLGQVSYAFFDSPGGFAVRIGGPGQAPVYLRLGLEGYDWKLVAVYY
jgi:hypothetical protein